MKIYKKIYIYINKQNSFKYNWNYETQNFTKNLQNTKCKTF